MVNFTKSPHQPILLMAGGTGGHVFPALAIAEALRTQGFAVCWLGTRRGLEARVVPDAEIDIKYISIEGIRGKGLLSILAAPFKITLAIWQSVRVLRALRPAAVVGMGGFVTGPGGVAAWLLRIPLLIHEQNAIAGLTNRWLARLALKVMEAFPDTFPKKCHAIYTGNPLRANIMKLSPPVPVHDPWRILIVGGSLGAKALNDTVPLALRQVPGALEVWHQTGKIHIDAMQKAYEGAAFKARVVAFIEDMADAYAWADVVICRAGAITVGELAQAGVASILVPYPYAVDDHQTSNAQFLSKKGAAILLPQTDLTVEKLATLMTELHNNPARLQAMSAAARKCATPVALQKVVELVIKTAYSGKI
ncbi:undecaprenyldiphospho-muramoylpentapeptide beta-N- acetylglucosaminyltransferase [Candidatus Thiomargarita nelsonii]|uniref:UDP-N-acetylglucosamine--N-acetylmuramyl-(pentapeptide) pyrophosphoryl-undecaprenol N-acetylglucosamine transferase n=1 Tax=Candidatus Thiomargarita nelsonii TaxID=1003181 RepID=A0A176S4Q2_9GAMM|nr:undecaprenyldiphospho-muramoylpentapeptide beta-N- acetylglucosaminyltransferase [Candidatus Thiomargarita nelsonii]